MTLSNVAADVTKPNSGNERGDRPLAARCRDDAMNPIDVVSFGEDLVDSEKLKVFLDQSGCSVTFTSGRDFLSRQGSGDLIVTLIILGDSTLEFNQQAMLLNRLNCANHFANICLVGVPPDNIDTEFYSNFDDFIFWPCSRNELHARLSPFTQAEIGAHLGDVHARILEDFAAMNLLGESAVFVQLLEFIKKIAHCDATVLIEGETGTGKENAARAIHYLSARREHGFIPVNCGAIPDNLLESELFGHEKGAFTDARFSQSGLVEMADGGTLFLDEVDSLSSKAQAALLRFLQTHEYRPLGGRRLKHAEVRVIAASNANLTKRSEGGHFRKDLLFRLNVLSLFMPPLRDRPEDIAVIARSLLSKYAHQYNARPKVLHPKSLEWLQSQYWSGNIRELENVLLREFLLAEGPIIKCGSGADRFGIYAPANAQRVWPRPDHPTRFHKAKEAAINAFEIDYLNRVLELTAGNVTKAAKIAGKERRAFGRLLKKYKVDKTGYQNSGQQTVVIETSPHSNETPHS
jgi:DNA-binding NtrC family response regulator